MANQTPRPRDHRGRFVPLDCPDPDCDGRLRYEADSRMGDSTWRCDGLVGRAVEPLKACPFEHQPGEPYEPWPAAQVGHA